MGSQQILFHEGLNGEARSCLTKPGFLRQAENISFATDGKQVLRPPFASIGSVGAGVTSVKSFMAALFATTATELYGRSGGGFSSLTSLSAGDWCWDRYKKFLFGANGTDFVMVDENLNAFSPIIPNPITAASGTASGSGTITGKYSLWVSYLLTFPNGQIYETGLSPVSADITASTNLQINWTAIPLCPYTNLYGTQPIITRNLYRGPGSSGATISNIYYIDNIADNTTTTYTDTSTDAQLQANDVCYVDIYTPPPVPKLLAFHYGRIYIIPPVNSHRLWYTEPATSLDAFENENLIPIATTVYSWDDIRIAGFDAVDPQALVSWGINLYIALKQTWIRKQGENSATWGYKKTYARTGIGSPSSVAISSTPLGIIGVTNPEFNEPGLAIFTGQESQTISSPKLDFIFHHDLDISKITQCQGCMAGSYYLFIYPSIDATMKFLAIDMRRYPDIRVAYWTDLNGQSIDKDSQTSKVYVGGYDGYVRSNTTTESMEVRIETNDLGGSKEDVNKIKTFRNFKYALKGTVNAEFYVDDVLMLWPDGSSSIVLTGVDETLQIIQSLPQDWQGYRIRIKLTGTGLSELEIYSPWEIDLEAT